MLNDTDVDTCVPGGLEKHSDSDTPPQHPARTPIQAISVEAAISGLRDNKRKRSAEAAELLPTKPENNQTTSIPSSKPPLQRLLAARSLTTIATMIGGAMEAFNKSVKHRSLNGEPRFKGRAKFCRSRCLIFTYRSRRLVE